RNVRSMRGKGQDEKCQDCGGERPDAGEKRSGPPARSALEKAQGGQHDDLPAECGIVWRRMLGGFASACKACAAQIQYVEFIRKYPGLASGVSFEMWRADQISACELMMRETKP